VTPLTRELAAAERVASSQPPGTQEAPRQQGASLPAGFPENCPGLPGCGVKLARGALPNQDDRGKANQPLQGPADKGQGTEEGHGAYERPCAGDAPRRRKPVDVVDEQQAHDAEEDAGHDPRPSTAGQGHKPHPHPEGALHGGHGDATEVETRLREKVAAVSRISHGIHKRDLCRYLASEERGPREHETRGPPYGHRRPLPHWRPPGVRNPLEITVDISPGREAWSDSLSAASATARRP